MEKKIFEFCRKDYVFLILLCVAAFLLSAFGIFSGFNIGYTVSFIIMILIGGAYLVRKISFFSLACGILSVSTVLSLSITSNGTVRFFSFVASVIFALSFFIFQNTGKYEKGDLGVIKSVIAPLITNVCPNVFTTFRSFSLKDEAKKKTAQMVFIGIAISVPILFVVVPLLMNSDAAFTGLIESVFENLFLSVAKIIVAIIIAVVAVPYLLTLKKDKISFGKDIELGKVPTALLASSLSVLSVCYLTYLFSQLAYFFDAFRGFLPEKFTLSEYARRGFFEMTAISAINFVIVFAVLIIAKKSEGKLPVILRALCTFISGFTLLIIATAFSKMVLYIKELGMTVLRITTSSFMLFLGIVFISLILRIYISGISVIKTIFITAGVILTVLGTVNVNAFVARYNYSAYKSGVLEKTDTYSFYELGDEGVEYLYKLATEENSYTARSRLYQIVKEEKYYSVEKTVNNGVTEYKVGDKKHSKPEEFTVVRRRAENTIEQFINENLEQIAELYKAEEKAENRNKMPEFWQWYFE